MTVTLRAMLASGMFAAAASTAFAQVELQPAPREALQALEAQKAAEQAAAAAPETPLVEDVSEDPAPAAAAPPAEALVEAEMEAVAAPGGETAGDAAPSEVSAQPAAAVAPAASPEPPPTIRFSRPVYTLDDVYLTTIFGVGLDMSTDDARAALLDRGFVEPVSGVLPSIGFHCDAFDADQPCRDAGFSQSETFVWTRGDEIERDGAAISSEQVLPFFYLNRDGVQRLYSLQYVKHFNEPVNLDEARALYAQRFGEPTEQRGDGVEKIELSYVVQARVPAGLTPTPSDQRMPSQFALQRAVEATRSSCLKEAMSGDDAAPSQACLAVETGDAREQDVFEALTNAVLRPDQSNAFLGVVIEPFQTKIFLIGHFLPEAERLNNAREEAVAAAEEARVEAEKEAEATIISDDL